MAQPDYDLLAAALAGYEHQRSQVAYQIQELQRRLGKRAAVSPFEGSAPAQKPRRRITPEGLERIRQGQLNRWARVKAAERKPAPAAEAKKVKVKSAAG